MNVYNMFTKKAIQQGIHTSKNTVSMSAVPPAGRDSSNHVSRESRLLIAPAMRASVGLSLCS